MISSKFIQILVIFFAVLLFLVSATPLGRKKPFNRKRILINGRPWHGMKPVLNLAEEPYPGKGNAVEEYFMNKINHFDSSSTGKYKQRYWYNKKFYVNGGPVFLMLGGESAENAVWVEREDFEWTSLAKEHNAMLFLLEHRYYGKSRPTKDMSTQNMQYLSSRQAIEDAAAFIRGMNERFNFANQTRWVLFGGSYSGALAAWARQAHPEVIFAAVGSSGPVQAEVDFYKYLYLVKNILSKYSPQCSNDLEKGLKKLETLVKTEDGARTISSVFNLCTHWSKLSNEDKEYFWLSIIGPYMGIVQYSGDNVGNFRTTANIPTLCSYHMDLKQTPIQHIVNVFNTYGNNSAGCLDVSYKEYINYLRSTSFDDLSASDRSWTYQTCTEFGYYHSTDYIANIPTLCSYHMDLKQTPIQHIVNVFNTYGNNSAGCLDVSYKEYINYLRSTSFDDLSASDRSWTYQTCTEFGYYHSTDYIAGNFWGRVLDANWYVRQCTDIFGRSINNKTVYLSVDGTNNFYGGAKGFKGTNVIFLNGLDDPWYALGVLSRTNERNYAVMIHGTAHCADMYPPSSEDLPSLTRARKNIRDLLERMLA
uniref:Serine protease K12H4.7 n=1 Tax=Strongyloides papillosus TaxID=174720 RepID=A0A0N5BSD9_STREA